MLLGHSVANAVPEMPGDYPNAHKNVTYVEENQGCRY